MILLDIVAFLSIALTIVGIFIWYVMLTRVEEKKPPEAPRVPPQNKRNRIHDSIVDEWMRRNGP